MNDPDPPLFRLTLRPLKGSVPVAVRLRRALKCLLRAFGFRCVEVRELPPAAEGGGVKPPGPGSA